MPIDPTKTTVVLIEYQNDFTSEGGSLYEAVKPVMQRTTCKLPRERQRGGVSPRTATGPRAYGAGPLHPSAVPTVAPRAMTWPAMTPKSSFFDGGFAKSGNVASRAKTSNT